MVLKKIKLINFKNYDKATIELDKKINIFLGENAQGKTNILEGIYVLALTKSHRILVDNNLIKKGEAALKIIGTIENSNTERKLEILISNNEKIVKINDNKILKLTDYISNLNVIMFCPDDLQIIKGSPSIRRDYLNIELGQISNKYLKLLNEYNKILKMRNEYLKLMANRNIENKDYYEIITDNLIERAVKILIVRINFINDINKKLDEIFYNITRKQHLQLRYETNIELLSYDEEYLKNEYNKKFKENFDREIQQGITLIGPHRDDFSFYLNEENLKLYGSQGQQRLSVLSLKITEIEIFKNTTGEYPILLLDDIFSELDKNKINNLFKYIEDKFQTLITTTDIKSIKKKLVNKSKIFLVENGKISIKQEVN
jgi:DNA replication and repair protein RecF